MTIRNRVAHESSTEPAAVSVHCEQTSCHWLQSWEGVWEQTQVGRPTRGSMQKYCSIWFLQRELAEVYVEKHSFT